MSAFSLSSGVFAPAKINLFLHVGPPQPDGFHPLSSLMAFADVGDRLTLAPAERLSLAIQGPFSEGLTAGEDNLVLRAVRALFARSGRREDPVRLVLDKQLPLAAGLGGGSSDAGAALKLVRDHFGLPVDDDGLEAIAAELGADGAACFRARPVIAEGRGERLSPAPRLPPLDAVLVNPRVPSPTGGVYRAYDDSGSPGSGDGPVLPEAFEDSIEAAAFFATCRNDLEAPAVALTPRIGDVLETLRGEPECLMGRVSGSGATCFALCAGDFEAESLAERIERMQPDWWVRRCRLGDGG